MCGQEPEGRRETGSKIPRAERSDDADGADAWAVKGADVWGNVRIRTVMLCRQ